MELDLPVLTVAEPLRDTRQRFASFRAVMRGPHLLAALTHDTRTAAVEADAIADAVSRPPADGWAHLPPCQILSGLRTGTV
jgi:hypothetical protein